MGKAGRAACIFTPLALSIASFICILLINLGGINKNSSTLNSLSFFTVNFENFTTSSSSSEIATLLAAAKDDGDIADVYEIHLWNYCISNSTTTSTTTASSTTSSSSNSSSTNITSCSTRKSAFWFDPLTVWNIDSIINDTESSVSSDSSVLTDLESLASNSTALEDELLGSSARDALSLYKKLSAWLWSAYFISLWLLLITVLFGCLAIFSRLFSLLTWIASVLASVLVFGGSITASVMFPIVVKTLKESFGDYGVTFKTSTHTLVVTWFATIFTLFATFFWLFTICCCAGHSNPHHRSNTEAPAAAFGVAGLGRGRRTRGAAGQDLEAEKMAGAYEPVDSPYGTNGDHVPLTSVAAQQSYGYHQNTAYAHGPEPPAYGHGEAAGYYHPTAGQHPDSLYYHN